MNLTPTKMLANSGDYAPGQGERRLFEIAGTYLAGMQPDLYLSAGQVVQETLSPTGRRKTVTPDSRLSADVIAAAVHDLAGDKPIDLSSFRILGRSVGGYLFTVTIMPCGRYVKHMEIYLRVLKAPA